MNHDDTSVAVDELAHEMQSLDAKLDEHSSPSPSVSPSEHVKFDDHVDHVDESVANVSRDYYQHEREYFNDSDSQHQQYFRGSRTISPFHYNKRQTGKKNLSSIIVGNDNKIEFDQIDDKGFGVVKINRPIGVTSPKTHEHLNDNESINSRDSRDSHTADGFFDLKFYSHPLW